MLHVTEVYDRFCPEEETAKPICGLLWGEAGQMKPLDSAVDVDHLPKSGVGFGQKGFSQVLL